jgi:hypothetical protein
VVFSTIELSSKVNSLFIVSIISPFDSKLTETVPSSAIKPNLDKSKLKSE